MENINSWCDQDLTVTLYVALKLIFKIKQLKRMTHSGIGMIWFLVNRKLEHGQL